MRAAALALLVTGACGRIGFDSLASQDAADPNADPDNDGLSNAIDNCPLAGNADQHDEDQDSIGDACDRCPHLGVPDIDGDGDGVGDACDPAPGTPGNKISAFVTFRDASGPTGWLAAPGAWTFGGDVGSIALFTDTVALLTTPTLTGDMTVSMRFTVDAVSGPGGAIPTRNVTLVDNYDPAGDSGLFFGLAYDTVVGPPADIDILRITNGSPTFQYASTPCDPMIHTGVPYVLTYRRTGTMRDMTLVGEEGTFTLMADVPDGGGAFGIRARGTTVRFEYLIAIQ